MQAINSFRTFFWDIDPGYLNLKQAVKTILAILISLLIVSHGGLSTKMMAGIGSAIAMQGVVAQNFRERLLHVIVFNIFYFSVFSLGLVVRDAAGWSTLFLIALGFFVNYIRRFGLEKSLAPFMVWLLGFLATILPFSTTLDAWVHIYGLLVGLGVSGLVILGVFPANYQKLFIRNTNHFFQTVNKGMESMRRHLLIHNDKAGFNELPFVQIKQTLIRIADVNHAMQHSRSVSREDPRLSQIMVYQYALINAYSLLVDAYSGLSRHPFSLPRSTELTLSLICKKFSRLFAIIYIEKGLTVCKKTDFNFSLKLSECLGGTPINDPEMIITLLNFKLGFDLISQTVNQLIREKHES